MISTDEMMSEFEQNLNRVRKEKHRIELQAENNDLLSSQQQQRLAQLKIQERLFNKILERLHSQEYPQTSKPILWMN